MYSNMMFLPFYKPVMNIANILHSGCFTSATVFLACAYVRGMPEVCSSSLACGIVITSSCALAAGMHPPCGVVLIAKREVEAQQLLLVGTLLHSHFAVCTARI